MSTAAITPNILQFHQAPVPPVRRRNGQLEHHPQARLDFHQLLESVWLNSSDAMRITDSEGIIVAVNDTYCRLVSVQMEQLVGEPFTVVYDSSVNPSSLLAKYRKRFKERNVEPLMNRQIRLRNGKEIFVEASNSYIEGSNGGTFVLGIIRDITDRKTAEEVISRLHRQQSLVLNSASEGIFGLDMQGRHTFVNPSAARLLGYEVNELIGRHSHSTWHYSKAEGQPFPAKECPIYAALRDGKEVQASHEVFWRKDGSSLPVEYTATPIWEGSQLLGAVVTFRDITERKELECRVQESLSALQASRESLAELNAQKDRLFSVISHDLRSPFTSILGFCEILLTDRETITDAERTEFLTYIRDAAKRQLVLLNKLLDWSRLETGRVKFEIEDVDLGTVVDQSVESHLGTAKQKGITLRSTLPSPMIVRGDEEMLAQVFNNLISNALKFTPHHGVISIAQYEGQENEWVIAVKDTGRGIPKEDFSKLFKVEEKYTQRGLDGEEGTGLGLSLVAEIVKKHNGSISVESELGNGTTFHIRFPRLIETTEQTVMVVDDDEGIRVLHSRYLKRMFPHAHVIQASNGKEAFERAKRLRPRFIVTDYSMPEMNGYEFLNLLKGEPSTRHIPVFVITGKGSLASGETLMFTGAAAVLDKPVSSKQLQETIERVLAEKV